jgi:hypothetical protein
MAELGIHGRLTSAQRRMVNRVVVDQRRNVDEFDDCTQRDLALTDLAYCSSGEQQQRRPQHLPLDAEKVLTDLFYQGKIGADDVSQLRENSIQLCLNWPLDSCQCSARHA